MRYYLISLLFLTFFTQNIFGATEQKSSIQMKNLNDDSFFDPEFDYSSFMARVTDRDKTGNIIKLFSDNKNVKFFRSGDEVRFRVSHKETKMCRGYVRSVENQYFILYVQDLYECWKEGEYFRRGALLQMRSIVLATRVRDASLYRVVLLNRRADFFSQLNDTNHFIWSYDQERVKTAAEYDKKIIELQKAKQRALELLVVRKSDSIKIQKELTYRVDQLDKDLDFYMIEKSDADDDRWNKDHDLGKPVGKRPPEIKILN